MSRISLTADDDVSAGIVDTGYRGVAVIVESGGSLGGGTLTLKTRPSGSTGDKEIVDTLALGDQYRYEIGRGQEAFVVLSGSTAPDVWVDVHQV